MGWFFFAFLAAFLFSVTIVTDKYLVDKLFGKLTTISITAIAGLAGIPYLILFLILNGGLPPLEIMISGFAAGWLLLGSFLLYYKALRLTDAAMVTVLYLMILPINYVLGILFFDENLQLAPIAGLVAIVVSCIMVSFEQRESKWKLSTKVLGTMFISSLFWSLSDVVFKSAAENARFFDVAVAEYASTVCFALILLLFLPKVRKEISSLRKVKAKATLVTQFNEIVTIGATFSLRFALILGPIALVQGVMGTQPFIVLLLTYLVFLFVRKNKKDKFSEPLTTVTLISFILVILGSVLLSFNG